MGWVYATAVAPAVRASEGFHREGSGSYSCGGARRVSCSRNIARAGSAAAVGCRCCSTIAPARRCFVEDVIGRLDAPGRFEFGEKIAGRNRRHPLRQRAHKPAPANVAILEQEHGLQFGISCRLVVQNFEGGPLAPILKPGIWVDRPQSLKLSVYFGRHNLHLRFVRPNPTRQSRQRRAWPCPA